MAWITAILLALCLVHVAEPKTFRWCYQGDEMEKCKKFMEVVPLMANMSNIKGMFETDCVKGDSDEDCMQKIKDSKADFITLDGNKVFIAGKKYGLVPLVAEKTNYGLVYYGVAVAKKSSSVTLKTLKGKKTCHTGYRRTAGWNLPIGWFLRQSDFRTGCGSNIDAKSASKYFKESCVPGVPEGYPNLRAICPVKDCKGGKYLGYAAAFTCAFDCMKDGAGDVAFVKHTTTRDVVGDNTTGYVYLCTDGTRKEVTPDSHINCSFAQSVSHTVVTRSSDSDYVKILMKAAEVCTEANKDNTAVCKNFVIFDSKSYGSGKNDLLFKDKATTFEDVKDKNTYLQWLGDEYVKDIEALQKPGPACSSAIPVAVFPGLLVVMVALMKTLL